MLGNNIEMDKFDIGQVVRSCYEPKDPPVILTSGKVMSPFFLNGHLFLEDGVEYKKYEMDPLEMMKYSLKRYDESENFRNSIDYAIDIIDGQKIHNLGAISGGRTRDWPFASVIASKMSLPFLALFKPEDNIGPKLYFKERSLVYNLNDFSHLNNIYHIVDLTTDGGSIIKENGGWVSQIRDKNGTIENVMAFISRNPNNVEMMKFYDIDFRALGTIDEDWLTTYDKENAKVNAEFARSDPLEWTKDQLRNMTESHTISRYFDPINPSGDVTIGKDDRHLKFMLEHKDLLKKTGMWELIRDSIWQDYNINVEKKLYEFVNGS